ncbi:MAG: ATP-binding protein [Bacteroidales bacterium]|nr:ATP-binding protein [Bacteroidales bacterium]
MKTFNPFVLGRYESPEYFCNRTEELKRVDNCIKNQRNLTIISHRRLGKTGIILHYFNQIHKQKELQCIYLDLMHTHSTEDFIKAFAKSVIGKFDRKTTQVIKTFTSMVKSIRPSITIDSMTGEPKIDISLQDPVSRETTIEEIFTYLKSQKMSFIIAFDEFQQINNYHEKKLEALLRGQIQLTTNTTFIFSGSQKHMLLSMFGDNQRPFYQSTDFLNLGKIDREEYKKFIAYHFEKNKSTIETEAIDLILDLTEVHTFYVQFICNKLYSTNSKKITIDLVVNTMLNILKEHEVIYYNYRNLMTEHQFNLLKAIALEGLVKMPTSKDFIQKYRLSAASTIKTNLDSLINKEMILQDEIGYKVYDVFFGQWLKRLDQLY